LVAQQIALRGGGELFEARAADLMVDARKLQRTGESHEPVHGRAEDQLLAQHTGLAEARCRGVGGLAIQVVSFGSLLRELEAKHANKPGAVGAGGENHHVSFYHLPSDGADSLYSVASDENL
jgi:hypothetical protein